MKNNTKIENFFAKFKKMLTGQMSEDALMKQKSINHVSAIHDIMRARMSTITEGGPL